MPPCSNRLKNDFELDPLTCPMTGILRKAFFKEKNANTFNVNQKIYMHGFNEMYFEAR